MTIAEQLKIIDFPFQIKDKCGNIIYREYINGYWCRREWENGNQIYFEDSDGSWNKREWENGKEVYFESSKGYIMDNRPKNVEITLEEIAEKFGIKVENLRIKD